MLCEQICRSWRKSGESVEVPGSSGTRGDFRLPTGPAGFGRVKSGMGKSGRQRSIPKASRTGQLRLSILRQAGGDGSRQRGRCQCTVMKGTSAALRRLKTAERTAATCSSEVTALGLWKEIVEATESAGTTRAPRLELSLGDTFMSRPLALVGRQAIRMAVSK